MRMPSIPRIASNLDSIQLWYEGVVGRCGIRTRLVASGRLCSLSLTSVCARIGHFEQVRYRNYVWLPE